MFAHLTRWIVVLLALFSFLQSAKSSEPPADPEGWKRVTSKDGASLGPDFLSSG